MAITRTRLAFERDFVQIPNAWMRDERLSRRARGLLAEIMTHEPGWKLSTEKLMEGGSEGRDAIRAAVKELADAGYLKVVQTKSRGKFAGVDYEINDPELPAPENPTLEIRSDDGAPPPGNPAPGNPQLRILLKEHSDRTTSYLSGAEQKPHPLSDADAPTQDEPLIDVKAEEAVQRFDPVVHELCEHLALWVERNTGRKPNVGIQWLQACERLMRIDGRTPQHIRLCIDWCQTNEFWCGNILSMPKLREKYEQLRLAAQHERAKSPQSRVNRTLQAGAKMVERLERDEGQIGSRPIESPYKEIGT